jgi:outer membrane protein
MSSAKEPLVTSDARSTARGACFALALATLLPVAAGAQSALSLEQAIDLARLNNADYLATRNAEHDARWRLRESYGSLMPAADVSTSFGYQGEGNPRYGVVTFDQTPAYYFSDYGVGLTYQLGATSLLRPVAERANVEASEARTSAAGFLLSAEVTWQYLAVLRAQDAVELARQELIRTEENLRLAQTRVAVGAAIALEAKQAEVEHGRAQVGLLQAENVAAIEKLRLGQRVGLALDPAVELTTRFDVFEPGWSEAELVDLSAQVHPQLHALRATERATSNAVRMARGTYLPTLSFYAGLSGYTRQAGDTNWLIGQAEGQAIRQIEQCHALNEIFRRLADPLPDADCSAFGMTDADRAAIRDGNSAFPFQYTRQPLQAQLRISLPIFQGFTRQRQIEQARVQASDAQYRLRAEELRLRSEIGGGLQTLTTAYQAHRLEGRTLELADEQLHLARERYRVGAASFLELREAETIKARADRAYLISVYSFHEALTGLEAAVGRRLVGTREEQ